MIAMAAANLLVVNHTLFSVLCCFGWTGIQQQQQLKSVTDKPCVLGNIEKIACFTNTEKGVT